MPENRTWGELAAKAPLVFPIEETRADEVVKVVGGPHEGDVLLIRTTDHLKLASASRWLSQPISRRFEDYEGDEVRRVRGVEFKIYLEGE
mgnify:CR=1 FL=1